MEEHIRLLPQSHFNKEHLTKKITDYINDMSKLYDLDETIRFYLDCHLISKSDTKEEPKICFNIKFKGDTFLFVSYNDKIQGREDREDYMLGYIKDTYSNGIVLGNYTDDEQVLKTISETINRSLNYRSSYKRKMVKSKNSDFYSKELDNIKQSIKNSLQRFDIFTENIEIVLERDMITVEVSKILYFKFHYFLGILFIVNKMSFGTDSKNYLLVIDKLIPIEEELVCTIADNLHIELY